MEKGKTQQQKELEFCKELFRHCKTKNIGYCFIVSSNSKWYPAIKAAGDIEGVQTTVTLRKAGDRAMHGLGPIANLLLKFNLKIGGVNWTLNMDEFSGILRGRSVCFFGVDVVHPPHGARPGSPSVAGIVSSTSLRPGQFTGKDATR